MVDATSQALAVMLLDSSGAMAWIAWARRRALEAGTLVEDPVTGEPVQQAAIEPPRALRAVRRCQPELAPAP